MTAQPEPAEDGWVAVVVDGDRAQDYAVFDALQVDGKVIATIECFATHRTFYANAVDKSGQPFRRVCNEFDHAKNWCESVTGFVRMH